jgi:hypothetical protein
MALPIAIPNPGIVTGVTLDEADQLAADVSLAKDLGDAVAQKYPGYRWYVNANIKQGIADVRCGNLHGGYGFTLKLTTSYSASQLKADALRLAGELLERFNVSRRGANDTELRTLKRDARGQGIPEL